MLVSVYVSVFVCVTSTSVEVVVSSMLMDLCRLCVLVYVCLVTCFCIVHQSCIARISNNNN